MKVNALMVIGERVALIDKVASCSSKMPGITGKDCLASVFMCSSVELQLKVNCAILILSRSGPNKSYVFPKTLRMKIRLPGKALATMYGRYGLSP